MSLRWRQGISLSVGALLGVLLFAGCKGFETTKDIGFYTVKAERTRVFLFAPGHASEGDIILTQGQQLVMLRQEFGYSHVMTADGQKGYVATNDVEPERRQTNWAAGTPRPPPPAMPSRPPRGSSASSLSSANRSVLQSGALFENPLPPLPENPEIAEPSGNGTSKPKFRVSVHARSIPAPEPKNRSRKKALTREAAKPEARSKGE